MPHISSFHQITKGGRVLEIGCGEGGNMKPFVEAGCEVVGVDINISQLEKGKSFYADLGFHDNPQLIGRNIYDMNVAEIGTFDIIMLRDVIEHIPDQNKFMGIVGNFLKDDGVIFFGFPPWYMPFGGHQQMCKTKAGKLPFMHLLPRSLYGKYLKLVGESDLIVDSRLEIHDTGITIERFNRIVRNNGFELLDETLYLINPNYEAKFSMKPRKQFPILRSLPYLRNLYTTCCYATIRKSGNK